MKNVSIAHWATSRLVACSLWFVCLMECHLHPHLTKEALNVYNLVSLTANPIKIPMKLSKTSEKQKSTCDLHFLQNHRFQDGRSEFLLRLKKMCIMILFHTLFQGIFILIVRTMKIVESLTWIEGIIQIELLWGSLSSLGNAPPVCLSVTLLFLCNLGIFW